MKFPFASSGALRVAPNLDLHLPAQAIDGARNCASPWLVHLPSRQVVSKLERKQHLENWNMKKLFCLGALVAGTLLVGCVNETELDEPTATESEETRGEVSSALAPGCTHTAFAWRSGTTAWAQGAVSCSSRQSEINVDATLRRDGTPVAGVARGRCFDATSCSARASSPDLSGTQQWCAFTRAGTPLIEPGGKTHCVSF